MVTRWKNWRSNAFDSRAKISEKPEASKVKVASIPLKMLSKGTIGFETCYGVLTLEQSKEGLLVYCRPSSMRMLMEILS